MHDRILPYRRPCVVGGESANLAVIIDTFLGQFLAAQVIVELARITPFLGAIPRRVAAAVLPH